MAAQRQRLRNQLTRLERDLAEHARAVERAARRGHLSAFRTVGSDRDQAWPSWASALRGQSGCYVIRDAITGRYLYVGSAKNDLYATMTRHFQGWRRNKKWWKGLRGQGAHDPGLVYKRSQSEVAVQLTERDERLQVEAALIERLAPRDNLVAHPDGAAEADGELAGEPDVADELIGDLEEAPF